VTTDRPRRDVRRATIAAAYERIRADLLSTANHAELKPDSQVRKIMLRTLEKLHEELDRDPEWFDDVLPDLPPES
jgi:hypothetical protein